MLVVPRLLAEVISVTPAMWPNWRSRGVAMEDAMMSGLAPGSEAATVMVGKSTCGSGDTGNTVNAITPASATATVSSVVATGRWMKMRDGFMPAPFEAEPGWRYFWWIYWCADERAAPPDCRRRCRSPA